MWLNLVDLNLGLELDLDFELSIFQFLPLYQNVTVLKELVLNKEQFKLFCEQINKKIPNIR